MDNYWQIFVNGYKGYANYLWKEISNPHWQNYFYWLIGVSVFFLLLEWWRPWRKNQPRFRKDFWLDAFYMFFNFFLFSLIIYNAASDVVVAFFNRSILSMSGLDLSALNPMRTWPAWSILLVGFILRDFVQWWIHRLLHRSSWLWEFHKVHHSVQEMGFAAQLRYHWMENIVYRSLEYIPLALLGIGLHDFFIIHIFTLAIGHFNHSNLSVSGFISAAVVGAIVGFCIAMQFFDINLLSDPTTITQVLTILGSALLFSAVLGPVMKKVFNSPEMHIWHHSYDLPEERRFGVNFGLSLAIWDYIFGTAFIPTDGRDIRLGFPGIESFPGNFIQQNLHGYLSREQRAECRGDRLPD